MESDNLRRSLRKFGDEEKFPEGLKNGTPSSSQLKGFQESPTQPPDIDGPVSPDKTVSSNPDDGSQAHERETFDMNDTKEYLNVSDYSESISKDSSTEEKQEHFREIMDYTEDV